MKIFKFGLMFFAFLLSLSVVGCSTNPPSDKSMEENFKSRRADFEKLVVMLKEDAGVETIDGKGINRPNYTDEANLASHPVKVEMPVQRLEEYRELLRRTGVKQVSRDRDEFVFSVWKTGHGFFDFFTNAKHQRKDYIFTEKPPSTLVNSLEDPDKLQGTDVGYSGHKKIAEGWYLSYWISE